MAKATNRSELVEQLAEIGFQLHDLTTAPLKLGFLVSITP